MENLLYVLLGILWVAYSLYSAKQKAIQKQKKQQIPGQRPSQSFPLPIPQNGGRSVFEDLFRELTGETGTVRQQPEQVLEEKHDRPKIVSQANKPTYDYFSYDLEPGLEKNTPSLKSQIINSGQVISEDTPENKENRVNFDLRQAVIFSELLNRKYF
jgi:hypothetical protein